MPCLERNFSTRRHQGHTANLQRSSRPKRPVADDNQQAIHYPQRNNINVSNDPKMITIVYAYSIMNFFLHGKIYCNAYQDAQRVKPMWIRETKEFSIQKDGHLPVPLLRLPMR